MTVYVCCADDRKTHLEAASFDTGPILVDGDVRADQQSVVAAWRPISFAIAGSRRKGAAVQDVYMSGAVRGISLYVSQRCRELLDATFPGQCTLLPVEVPNAHSNFYALWANHVREDALDKEHSDLLETRFGTKHLSQYVFFEDRLEGTAIFRLPPAYAGMWDLVTDRFVDAVRVAGLIGFSFWDRTLRAERGTSHSSDR